MTIKLHLDLQPHEDGLVERYASEWRVERLQELCEDCGWSGNIHSDGLGLELIPENFKDSDMAESLGGLTLELIALEEDFLSGRPYRQIISDLQQPSYLEW